MGATMKKAVGDLKFYKTVRLGNLAWKVYFRDAAGQRWKATVTARRYFIVTEPNPTGVRVTIQPLTLNLPKSFTVDGYPKFHKDWHEVGFPTEKGEVRLLVALTAMSAKMAEVLKDGKD
jgi:hypothetical protein